FALDTLPDPTPMAIKKTLSAPLNPTRNDLVHATREKIAELLRPQLLASVDLYLRCKHAHWNVKGPQFSELHRLFDEIAADALESAAERAEPCVQPGPPAPASPRDVAPAAPLPDPAGPVTGWQAFTDHVADVLAAYGKSVRITIDEAAECGDADTADLCTE